MKTTIQFVLWIVCIGFGYLIYISVNAPIEFKKVKLERFGKVIYVMKDITKSQEAYRSVNGNFADDFNSLISFIETGNFTITQQRDSSYYVFNKIYGIDMLKEVKIIDTLGTVSVKDSLFKNNSRYKTMMNIPYAKNGDKFVMKADVIEKSGYRAPVFEVKASKSIILFDQPKDLMLRENNIGKDIEEVSGSDIIVGSLKEVSTNGNWPPVYDKKNNEQ